MKIVQLGVCVGNDDLTKLIGDNQPDLLVLVEPMTIHNDKIKKCYKWVNNLYLENIAISLDDVKQMSFYYHKKILQSHEIYQNIQNKKNVKNKSLNSTQAQKIILNYFLYKYYSIPYVEEEVS